MNIKDITKLVVMKIEEGEELPNEMSIEAKTTILFHKYFLGGDRDV